MSYLKNKSGIEIAGPSGCFCENGILPIYPIIANLDDYSFDRPIEHRSRVLKEGITYDYSKYKKKGYQYIGDTINLNRISAKTYDFILASHVAEHIANLFKAIIEWMRILKDNGLILLIVPHKDGTFDHNRRITSLDHFIEDYRNDIGEDDLSHLKEALQLTDINRDAHVPNLEFLKERSEKNYLNRFMHHHVFNTELIIKIFDYFKLQILAVDIIAPFHIVIMGKKTSNKQTVDNSKFISKSSKYKHKSKV